MAVGTVASSLLQLGLSEDYRLHTPRAAASGTQHVLFRRLGFFAEPVLCPPLIATPLCTHRKSRIAVMAFSDPNVYQIPYVEGMPVGKKLKLWNLPPNCPREDLLEWFHAVNVGVDSLEFTDDPVLNAQGIGGFVEFTTKQDACVAIIRLDGYKLKGRSIRMDFVEKRPYSKDYGRKNRNKTSVSHLPRTRTEIKPPSLGVGPNGRRSQHSYQLANCGNAQVYTRDPDSSNSVMQSDLNSKSASSQHPVMPNSQISSSVGDSDLQAASPIDMNSSYQQNIYSGSGHSSIGSLGIGDTGMDANFVNRVTVSDDGYTNSRSGYGPGLDHRASESISHSPLVYDNTGTPLSPRHNSSSSNLSTYNAWGYCNQMASRSLPDDFIRSDPCHSSSHVIHNHAGTQFSGCSPHFNTPFLPQITQNTYVDPQFGTQQVYHAGSCRPAQLNKLFVGNLAWTVDDVRFKQLFSRHGTVLEARVIRDQYTGRSKGFGFVCFLTEDELQAAIEALDGFELDGRLLTVNVANSRRQGR